MAEYSQEELISKLTPQQRFKMMDLGMNPINPTHIKKFLNGQVERVDMNEKLERARAIIGEDAFGKSLGHSGDGMGQPVPGMYSDVRAAMPGGGNSENVKQALNNDPNYIRKQAAMQMDEYANRGNNTLAAEDLLSFGAPVQNRSADNKQKLQEAQEVGKTLATNYYNAFIQSLQNPSTASHMNVYKALKTMLEQEKKLQNTQLLPYYQKSVNGVAKKMHQNITNRLND